MQLEKGKTVKVQKNIFVPLKTEHYEAFERGSKTHELRKYGKRWNENTCTIGRGITLSKGYGKNNRMHRTIFSFQKLHVSKLKQFDREAFQSCYGTEPLYVAVVGVSIASPAEFIAAQDSKISKAFSLKGALKDETVNPEQNK